MNTGVGCHFLLQGIFPTHGSNPGLLHCRHILYHLTTSDLPWKDQKATPPPKHTHIQSKRDPTLTATNTHTRTVPLAGFSEPASG